MEELVAFFLAAGVISLVQFRRLRDRRLLPLLLLFVLLALAHARGEWDAWGRLCHYGAGACGLVLLFMLSPRARG
jgi:hypothetical protein